MSETGKLVLIRVTELIRVELDSLSGRLEIGGKLIDSEMSEERKERLLKGWSELDKAYKRLQLTHSVLTSPEEGPLTGVYCAVCLGLVKTEQLLESGWELPKEESEQ